MRDAAFQRLAELAEFHLGGNLDSAQMAELESLLDAQPERQRIFLDICQLHAQLSQEFYRKGVDSPGALSDLFRPAGSTTRNRHAVELAASSKRRRLWQFLAVASSLLLLVTMSSWWWSGRELPKHARLVHAVNALWGQDREIRPDQELPAQRMQLKQGLAEIQFYCGATAIIEAPADFDIVGEDTAYLRSGRILVRINKHGKKFRLETPTANLLDLGTEFGVVVNDQNGSLLQVYDGEVLATAKAQKSKPKPQERLVKVGEAVQLDKELESVEYWPDRFVRDLPDPYDNNGHGKYPYNVSLYDTLHIVPAKGTVKIDADLSDWDLSGRFRSVCFPPFGHNHYSEAAFMYDDQYLYVAAHVGDPYPMRSKISPDVTQLLYGGGGGIALRISADRKLGWPLTAESKLERKPHPLRESDKNPKLNFLMLWHYQPDGRACLHIRSGMDLHGSKVNPPGYQGAYREDADGLGYTLEYAIPWSLLNAGDDPPRAGDELAAMWLVHWSDEQGATWKGQLIDVMKPDEHGWNFDRAATWGKAIYHPHGQLPKGTVRQLQPHKRIPAK